MNSYFVDLHVHIGRSSEGKEIKKATAGNLTFENIACESFHRKGIDIIGVVDCISPHVIRDIERLMESGELVEKDGGGMEYRGRQTLLPGAEIETHEPQGGSSHSLCFFPTLKHLKSFADEMKHHVRNMEEFSSMSRLTGQELFSIVDGHGGIFMPAHAFTPYKSFYGSSCTSLRQIFDEESFQKIPSIELGLSADAMMASRLSELRGKSFTSNSDAHSLMKMGREYNIFEMEDSSFDEVLKALKNVDGRRIKANYGLNPRLGKYHRTFCLVCNKILDGSPPVLKCPVSDRHRVVMGVRDRLETIADLEEPDMTGRPPYYYQVPLEFIPGVGTKTIDRLIERFGTEMSVLHQASFEELAEVVNEVTARRIVLAREGRLEIEAGGGGTYGKIET